VITILFASCAVEKKEDVKEFDCFIEQLADIKALRCNIPSFEELTLKEKKLIYYPTQAGLSGTKLTPQFKEGSKN
jgi:dipeptidyl-peptidase-3